MSSVVVMSAEDSLRRQLKFSFVLQVIGAVLFAVAFVIRALIYGLELTTWLFALGCIGISAIAVWTRKRLQELD